MVPLTLVEAFKYGVIDVSTRLIVLILILAAALTFAIWQRLQPAETTVSVYFIRTLGNQSTVEAVPRLVRVRGIASLLTAALYELLEGPSPSEQVRGLATAIPKGTRLHSVQIQEGIVRVDLSGEIESGGGSSSMLGRFWQMIYTATQFPDARKVRILIDGQEREAMGGEGVIIDHPIERPAELPRF